MILPVVLAAGFAVLVAELAAVRALQPFFGSTAPVWTNVIGVFLAALAAGAALGGAFADRRPSRTVFFGLALAGGLLLAHASIAVSPVSRFLLPAALEAEGVPSLLARGSLAATLLVFAPGTLLLGALPPFAVRLLARAGVGRAAGAAYGISTAGALAGTYLTTFLLVPAFGSRPAIALAGGLLLVLVLFEFRRLLLVLVIALIPLFVLLGDPGPIRPTPDLLLEEETPYQYVAVYEEEVPGRGTLRGLVVNEAVQGFQSLRYVGRVLTGYRAHDDYAALPLFLDRPAGADLRVGIVGLACGVNAVQLRHFFGGAYRLDVEGAEIDPTIVRLGRQEFGLPRATTEGLRVRITDGRTFVATARPRFHLLVLDAFANEVYVPFHLATAEFFRQCADGLEEGGLLAMNVYADVPDAPVLTAIGNTLASVFPHAYRSFRPGEPGWLLVARKGRPAGPPRNRLGPRPALPEWADLLDLADELEANVEPLSFDPGARVLTDDHAPVEWLTDRFLREREASRPDLAAARRRLDRALFLIGALWAAALLAAALLVRRR